MKKYIVSVFVAFMLVTLSGCGNSDKIESLESRLSELEAKNDTLMSWYEDIQAKEEEIEASKPDFEKIYESAPDDGTVSIAEDGLSLTVDTNPLNVEDYNSSEALTYIEEVNEELGLPDSLYERMVSTRAMDGTQSSEYDNVDVSWTYHPDNGLKVIYESK